MIEKDDDEMERDVKQTNGDKKLIKHVNHKYFSYIFAFLQTHKPRPALLLYIILNLVNPIFIFINL